MTKLYGVVRSGLGDSAQHIQRLAAHYQNKVGVTLYPGTLNVELFTPWSVPSNSERLLGKEYGGQIDVWIVPCLFQDRRAFILRTAANEEGRGDHPKTIVEVASDWNLREHYGLRDGDSVRVEFTPMTR